MECLINHPFEVGQVWGNDGNEIYVVAVNDDVKNEDGEAIEPGLVFLTDEKPYPQRKYSGAGVNPTAAVQMMEYHKYTLLDKRWDDSEFHAIAEKLRAKDIANAAKNAVPKPKVHGLGAMLMK